MPEYICKQCGEKHYGWSTSDKCECGGKLVAVDAEKWRGRQP